jgi:AcrR family transcriptional regulator
MPFQDTTGSTVPKLIAIPGKSDDSRAVHTRGQLASALIALMFEKNFDEISVREICERAHVGRSTFYAHFQDREDVFIRHTVVFGRALGEQLAWDEAAGTYRFPVGRLFAHVRQMKPLFDSLARARKAEFIIKVWQNNVAEVFELRVLSIRSAGSTALAVPATLVAQHLAGTLMTLMVWWMDHHFPLVEHEMERQFQKLIAGIER